MWWRDKVALNVSSHPIPGSPCQGPGEPPCEHATVAVEVTFMLRWANIFQVTFFNYTERHVPQATNPQQQPPKHTHTHIQFHTCTHINRLTSSPFPLHRAIPTHTAMHSVFSGVLPSTANPQNTQTQLRSWGKGQSMLIGETAKSLQGDWEKKKRLIWHFDNKVFV